jgi:hypothetical protein
MCSFVLRDAYLKTLSVALGFSAAAKCTSESSYIALNNIFSVALWSLAAVACTAQARLFSFCNSSDSLITSYSQSPDDLRNRAGLLAVSDCLAHTFVCIKGGELEDSPGNVGMIDCGETNVWIIILQYLK